MQAGLKILVSAIQSRPSPTIVFINFPLQGIFAAASLGTLRRIAAHDTIMKNPRRGAWVSAVLGDRIPERSR